MAHVTLDGFETKAQAVDPMGSLAQRDAPGEIDLQNSTKAREAMLQKEDGGSGGGVLCPERTKAGAMQVYLQGRRERVYTHGGVSGRKKKEKTEAQKEDEKEADNNRARPAPHRPARRHPRRPLPPLLLPRPAPH